jgi:hypothetical protein
VLLLLLLLLLQVMGETEWSRHRQAFHRHRLRPWSL